MNNEIMTQYGTPSAHLPSALAGPDAESYLTDESRMKGSADRVYFPQSEADLLALVMSARDSETSITLSGARTGIAGSAVPQGGWAISLEKMNPCLGLRFDVEHNEFRLRCQPGLSLDAIREAIDKKSFPGQEHWAEEDLKALGQLAASAQPWVFPPDPTERSASLGGMVACNASGARTLHYGPTRRYVQGLRILFADGTIADIPRGRFKAGPQGDFHVIAPDGTRRSGCVPGYTMPAVKNAAGLFSAPDMDLIDLFIGSEGTLGIFSEIEIALIPAPELILGVIGFFPTEAEALAFVRLARGERVPGRDTEPLASRPLALELFDVQSLNLLRDQKQKQGPSSVIPAIPETAHTAIYIELGTTEADMEQAAEPLMALMEACGCSADTAWTAITDEETERLKAFRHALPETVNQRIGERARQHPGLTKLGTDFAVPDAAMEAMIKAYRDTLDEAKLDYVIFGHIGNNHVHANILPRDLNEYKTGKSLYMTLAQTALKLGGTVSGEHGIGKLKKPFLRLMYGDCGIEAMRAVKQVFDPANRLNPGALFE